MTKNKNGAQSIDIDIKTIDWFPSLKDISSPITYRTVIENIKEQNNTRGFDGEDIEIKENINIICDWLLASFERNKKLDLNDVIKLISLGEYLFSSNNQHFDNHIQIAIAHKDSYIKREATKKEDKEPNQTEIRVHKLIDQHKSDIPWRKLTALIVEITGLPKRTIQKYKRTYPTPPKGAYTNLSNKK